MMIFETESKPMKLGTSMVARTYHDIKVRRLTGVYQKYLQDAIVNINRSNRKPNQGIVGQDDETETGEINSVL